MAVRLGEVMSRRLSALAIGFIAFTLLLSMAHLHSTAVSADADVVAFVGEKIYTSPTDAPISKGTVIVRGEKIVAVVKRGRSLASKFATTLRHVDPA